MKSKWIREGQFALGRFDVKHVYLVYIRYFRQRFSCFI